MSQAHCRRVERASIDEAYLDLTEEAAKLCQEAEAGGAENVANAPETDLQASAVLGRACASLSRSCFVVVREGLEPFSASRRRDSCPGESSGDFYSVCGVKRSSATGCG